MPSVRYLALFPRITTDINTKRPAKKTPTNRGYDHNRRPEHKVLLTENQVLEARWLYEFGRWNTSSIASHYELTSHYTRSLLAYATRGKIVPTKDSFPDGHTPRSRINSSDSPKG